MSVLFFCLSMSLIVTHNEYTTLFQHPSDVHNIQFRLNWRQNEIFWGFSESMYNNIWQRTIYVESMVLFWCVFNIVQ